MTRPTRTHCKNGHLLEGENLYLSPRGERCCRTCRKNAKKIENLSEDKRKAKLLELIRMWETKIAWAKKELDGGVQ